LNVHNLCRDINLTSPVHFIHGGRWNVVPDQEIDVNDVTRNRIELDSEQDVLKGALIYRIRMRQYGESYEFVEKGSKYTHFLIAWYAEPTKGLNICAVLVEYDSGFNWDGDKLRRLHQKCWHSLDAFVNFIRSNWLLNDRKILATTIKAMNGGYRWDIFITEGIKNNVERPLWINIER
jgi:hypothetical protein